MTCCETAGAKSFERCAATVVGIGDAVIAVIPTVCFRSRRVGQEKDAAEGQRRERSLAENGT